MDKTSKVKAIEARIQATRAEIEEVDELWERHDLHGGPNPYQEKIQSLSDHLTALLGERAKLTGVPIRKKKVG